MRIQPTHSAAAKYHPVGIKDHYLRTFIGQLRWKIEPNAAHPRHLETESGIGYRLRTPE
jgi:DNA-binding response OmpR family regulator